MAIAAFQFGAWLLTVIIRKYVVLALFLRNTTLRLYRFIEALPSKLRMRTGIAIALSIALSCSALPIMIYKPLGVLPSEVVGILTQIPLALLVLGPITNLVAGLPLLGFSMLAPLTLGIMFLALIPMGLDTVVMTIFFKVTVEAIPEGRWQVTQLVPEDRNHLSHSAIYEDDGAIATICQWIKNEAVST